MINDTPKTIKSGMRTDQEEVDVSVMQNLVDKTMNGPMIHIATLKAIETECSEIRKHLEYTQTQKTRMLVDASLRIMLTAASSLIGFIGYRNVGLMLRIMSENFYKMAEDGKPDESAPHPPTPESGPKL